jgi:predicted peroxiredoxin
MNSLKAGLEKSPKVTTNSNLSGFLGEEFWASVINTLHVSNSSQSSSGVEITLEGTGTMSETAARANTQLSEESQKIIQKYGERFTWASPSTSANADIVMTFNGKQARVQSKYERAEVQKLLKKKGGSRTFGTNIIGAKEKQPILEFIQTAAESGVNLVNMSQEQMGYTIANAIWFDMVDSIEHDQFVNRRTNALDILNAFVGTIVGNFIGLNLAQEEDTIYIVPEYSTLFYNIGNMRLIPTYEIIEGIRQQLFEGQLKTKAYLSNSNGKLANIVTSFTANNSTAEDLLEKKRNLADISEGESYINTGA